MPKKKQNHSRSDAKDEVRDVVGCMSCGMPTERTPREAASEIADICPRCADSAGHLKSYIEVFERLVTEHYMKELKMSRPEAEEAARARMAELPAWKHAKP